MKATNVLLTLLAILVSGFRISAEERVLLPVHVDIQGAFGSRFATDLAIHNFSEVDAVVRGVDVFCPLSGCVDPDPNLSGIPAGRTVDDFSPAGSPGRILLVPDNAQLEYALRARDYSRDEFSAGVDIPVVPERAFISRPFSLLNVFSGDFQFRSHLRIYGLAQTAVLVRFVRQSGGEVLHEQIVELSTPDSEFDPAFYEITQLPLSGLTPYRIELSSLSPDQPIWAFVSMTNNITQEITLATPSLSLSLPSEE